MEYNLIHYLDSLILKLNFENKIELDSDFFMRRIENVNYDYTDS